jgi:hypothetical protein
VNRIRLISFLVLPTLFILSACTMVYPLSPPTQTNPYNDLIQTMVSQTLTAFPYPTIQPGFTPTYTQTDTLFPQTPHEFISYYFDAINSRNYPLTWSLLTDRFKNNLNGSSPYYFNDYVNFWNSVNQVTVKDVNEVCQGDLCAVDATLELNYYSGQRTIATYPYTLTYEHTRKTWLFDSFPINSATATATRTKTRTPTATRTKTRTPTATRTKTSTPTATQTITRTASVTPTKTASVTPSQTHSPTPTLTRTPTPSFTPTSMATATYTDTASATQTETMTPAFTPTDSPTPTWTPSDTPTPTSGP